MITSGTVSLETIGCGFFLASYLNVLGASSRIVLPNDNIVASHPPLVAAISTTLSLGDRNLVGASIAYLVQLVRQKCETAQE